MGLNKINKPKPLAKMALDVLRSSILTNDLKLGVIYNEKNLAQNLGISRTPVREALLELSSKRLIKFLPQKGVIVNTFSSKDIDEVFETRTALELFSIKKVCFNHKTVDISLLKKCLTNQKDAARFKNSVEFMKADRDFHIGFTRLTDNSYLMDTMQDIRDIMHLMGVKALDIQGRMSEVVQEHENILNAVEKGNVTEAMEKMEYHLDLSRKAVKKIRKKEEENGKAGN